MNYKNLLNVTVTYQLFSETVSDRMWWTLKKKKDVISTIIGEKEFDDNEVQSRILDELVLDDIDNIGDDSGE
jgi:beta-mannanase